MGPLEDRGQGSQALSREISWAVLGLASSVFLHLLVDSSHVLWKSCLIQFIIPQQGPEGTSVGQEQLQNHQARVTFTPQMRRHFKCIREINIRANTGNFWKTYTEMQVY